MRRLLIIAFIVLPFCIVFPQEADMNAQEYEDDKYDEDPAGDFSWPDDEETGGTETGITRDTFRVYGYLINYFQTSFYWLDKEFDRFTLGDTLSLRVNADFEPEENVRFHMEAAYYLQTGNQNPYTLLERTGLMSFSQSNFPFYNFNQTFAVDHAYGSVSFGIFDLQFGKLPIAWGTGYVFNPTAHTASSAFLDSVTEETPGILGIVPSITFGRYVSLTGYLAFQDKSMKMTAFEEDASWRNLPFGIKMKAIIGSFDFSVSWSKEVLYSELTGGGSYIRNYYAGADFVGSVWDFGVYGEAALGFPVKDTAEAFDTTDYRFDEHFSAVFGLDYSIPAIDLELKTEYYFQGPGASRKEEYNIFRVMAGERTVQARHYLFGYLEKPFLDYFSITGAALINLNDGSGLFTPEFSYSPLNNFTMYFGGTVFWGTEESEFSGEYQVPGAGLVDFIENFSLYAKLKLSF